MPKKNPNQIDMFIANLIDVAPKGDQTSMEVPLFSLRKQPDTDQFIWEKGRKKITVTPNRYGRATIWDKDILIFLFSQIVATKNRGGIPARYIKVSAYDILMATGRNTGGKGYSELKDALRRLGGTRIETNINMENLRDTREFSLIQDWRSVSRGDKGHMTEIQITLSEWLYQAVTNFENVLTYDKKYFDIKKGYERRLYEIFRKHLGRKSEFTIGEGTLFHKMGIKDTPANVRNFRRFLRDQDKEKLLAEEGSFSGVILGFSYVYDSSEKTITAYPRRSLV